MRVIVSRTDRIGDVVLTLPLCAMLRERGAHVIFLGRRYTRPVLEASPFVDELLEWDEVEHAAPERQAAWLRAARADAIVHAFPRPTIARAAKRAGVALRIGTSHRLYHWWTCNALEHFSRKRSPLHEAQLDLRLARRLLAGTEPWNAPVESLAVFTALTPRVDVPHDVAALLARDRLVVTLHPGSRGSAREWPLDRWGALARSLVADGAQVVISGSAEEGTVLAPWLATLPPSVVNLGGRLALPELIALLRAVDGLVAASTGPLHLAAGVGAHALGLFAPTPPIHPGRWAPLGRRAEVVVAPAACSACGGGAKGVCTCMAAISVDAVRERIMRWDRVGVR